jgi:hypothetical protein
VILQLEVPLSSSKQSLNRKVQAVGDLQCPWLFLFKKAATGDSLGRFFYVDRKEQPLDPFCLLAGYISRRDRLYLRSQASYPVPLEMNEG